MSLVPSCVHALKRLLDITAQKVKFEWGVLLPQYCYRPQRSCGQGNVFASVCLSTGGRVSASVHAGMPDPPKPGRPPPPRDQADPPKPGTPRDQADPPWTRQTPPRTRQTPRDQADPPWTRQTPPDQADPPPLIFVWQKFHQRPKSHVQQRNQKSITVQTSCV